MIQLLMEIDVIAAKAIGLLRGRAQRAMNYAKNIVNVEKSTQLLVRASTERSLSLTSGGRRGQVQVQLREDPRQRGRRGEDESRGRSRESDPRRESGIPERDARALDNARETIRRGMNERRARTESEDNRRRGRVVREMRGRIDREREREWNKARTARHENRYTCHQGPKTTKQH